MANAYFSIKCNDLHSYRNEKKTITVILHCKPLRADYIVAIINDRLYFSNVLIARRRSLHFVMTSFVGVDKRVRMCNVVGVLDNFITFTYTKCYRFTYIIADCARWQCMWRHLATIFRWFCL